jgi:hypothetical protein
MPGSGPGMTMYLDEAERSLRYAGTMRFQASSAAIL